jgi:hypothetical protein
MHRGGTLTGRLLDAGGFRADAENLLLCPPGNLPTQRRNPCYLSALARINLGHGFVSVERPRGGVNPSVQGLCCEFLGTRGNCPVLGLASCLLPPLLPDAGAHPGTVDAGQGITRDFVTRWVGP